MALERIEMAVRLEEDVLCQVGRALAIAREPQAPPRDPFVMAREQLVDERLAIGARGSRGVDEVLV